MVLKKGALTTWKYAKPTLFWTTLFLWAVFKVLLKIVIGFLFLPFALIMGSAQGMRQSSLLMMLDEEEGEI